MNCLKLKKHIRYALVFLIFALGVSWESPAIPARKTYNFNSSWKLFVGDVEDAEKPGFDDSAWKEITLPYAWNQNEAFLKDIRDLSTGIAWYRKTFVLPEGNESNKVFLEFEGVRQAGEFYLNGSLVGLHENGAMAVGLDVSRLVKPYPAKNTVAVKTNNDWDYRERFFNQKYQWADRNFNANYGGIPKNVFLHIAGEVYQTLPLYSSLGTTGVYVYATDFDIAGKSAQIHVESEVKNETAEAQVVALEVRVEELDGREVARFEGVPRMVSPNGMTKLDASEVVGNLEFWSWGYGYLYTVRSRLLINGMVVDEVPVKTGFRKTAYHNGMVYLNDRVIMMKGYAQRTSNEWPAIGMSVPPWLSDYSNRLMTESNGNFVRWMHITPWKQDVESCDRVGLIQVMPAGDAERDVTGRRWDQRQELMRDAIIYNRNNPSILFYEGGNDNISEEHMAELKRIRDTFDPHGGRAIGSREMLDSKVAEYGGEMLYINKSAGKPLFATEYSRDEGLRKYWDEYSPPYHKDGDGPLYKGKDASEYNRNQDSHAIENVIRWYDYYRERPGTGERVSSGGANIIFSDTNTHYRGSENYRRSGEVDPMRIPKDGFWAHRVMWAGWVDLEEQLTHLIGHWNYQKGTTKNIYVVSGGAKVELFVNGQSKGFGEPSYRFLFTFPDISWEPGEIKAVSYNASGELVSEDLIQTAGKPDAIRLTNITSPTGFKADGADVALVEVEVVDQNGQRCPTALNLVQFELKGEAEWLGGIAQGENNYIGSKILPVEGGVNRVLIRSTTQAGSVRLKATAKGLKSASLELSSRAFPVTNGLSEQLPSDLLPVNLAYGPTPASPAYTVKRIPLRIAKATAGSNNELAANSYDDNEMSDWYNDGQLETAWINYELENESAISQVVLKLNNFRTKRYPIHIEVDGQKVFEGNTPLSLGYVSLKFPPAKGRSVKIQLTGGAAAHDDKSVEVDGTKLDDGVTRNDAGQKGRLSIIETEIYELPD